MSELSSTFVLALLGAALTALAVVTIALIALAGRQRRRDVREIVTTLEDMRSGRLRSRVDLGHRSNLALVADAVNRLGQDLVVRLADAESSDEGLKAVLDAARDYAVVATDDDWDVRTMSPGAVTLCGWEPEAVVGRPVSMLFDEGSWKDLLPKLARRSLRERGVESRATMVRRDGTTFPVRASVRALRGSGAEPSGYLLVVQDVTVEARLEGELRNSERRFRALLEGMPTPVGLVRDGRFLYGNPALATLLDTLSPDLAGIALRDRVATGHVLIVQETLARLQGSAEGETVDLHVTLLDVRGTVRALARLTLSSVVVDGAPAVLVAFVDETQERRADRELRRNEERLDAVVEAASEGLLVLEDTDGGPIVRMTNAAFLEMFGLAKDAVLGASRERVVELLRERGEGGAKVAALVERAGASPVGEAIEIGAGEAARSVDASVAPLRTGRGWREGTMIVLRDQSGQRTRERSLSESVDELRLNKKELEEAYCALRDEHEDLSRRQRDLDRLNQELRTLDSMKSDLLANVSHELQTPLVSIRGYTEMILKERLGPISAEQRQGLALSLRNIDRLIGLIDNLLALARMDRDVAELNISVFSVGPVVDEALELLGDRIRERRLTAKTSIEEPGLEIRADRDKILQVFVNLLSNAIKFNREGGSIEIGVRRGKPGFALVQVHDTGAGIPEEDLERIFDRFYRAVPPGGAVPPGTGIGLAIVRSILRLHGCVIEATSRVGRGTTFSFTLPTGEQVPTGPDLPEPSHSRTPSTPAPDPARGDPKGRAVPPPVAEREAGKPSARKPSRVDPASSPDRAPPRPPGAERTRLRIIRRSV